MISRTVGKGKEKELLPNNKKFRALNSILESPLNSLQLILLLNYTIIECYEKEILGENT